MLKQKQVRLETRMNVRAGKPSWASVSFFLCSLTVSGNKTGARGIKCRRAITTVTWSN